MEAPPMEEFRPRITSPELGRALAIERMLKGLDQRELAEAAGMRGDRLCRIERGKLPVSLREVARLVTALDATAPR